MVDGVNFNPFTMKAWSTEEIQQLDTDGDGKVSEAEVKSQWSWLSGNSQDAEGDVAIDDNAAACLPMHKKQVSHKVLKQKMSSSRICLLLLMNLWNSI